MKLTNSKGQNLFIHTLLTDTGAPNIIFICTPITTVTEFSRCYEPFAGHGFNVFAMDFSGVGQSAGENHRLNLDSMTDDLRCLVTKIKRDYRGKVYLFGSTGTGGVIAQYLTGLISGIDGFIQYGVCIYGDASPLGFPPKLLKAVFPLLRLTARFFPRLKVTFNPPKYEGFHSELDNGFYQNYLSKDPNFFKVPIGFPVLLLQLFLMEKTLDISVPVFVFKTNHDRYFPKDYFDKYYAQLTCPKKLYEIDDVHNSYYFYPEEICEAVSRWIWDLESP